MSVSQTFTCKCRQVSGWITEDEATLPCPLCKRIYIGKYNPGTLSVNAMDALKCQNCGKVTMVNEMYSVDACSEFCQDSLSYHNE